ncbi:hypothetical protein SELMODRAFT_422831 [Selaginella moellendorffii]|uniref:Pesticidal crystal protein domain-containing protein n=1 Tax=Selaginella moellendorffii TaxID=88036 RepID=D8SJP3_SELML|nr:uncharacterized protein LOC9651159 [Selaginella moellendorffii]EFJ15484.1 hypothetical protein SELMODRAFT_422831 [Selaginella moellendorffii]|eukprot:XP_002983583.1 uncharacterized protein LOC9651159 [Selaginella moellendorffii]
MVDVDVDQAILDGFQEGISLGLGMIPVVGSFVQAIFGHVWSIAFAGRTAEQNKAAMDSLFEAVGKMIEQALAENIADQARAANATISQLGQDYYVSVEAFKDDNSVGTQKIVVRFENCKAQLLQMLNLFSQPSYMKHTLLSYGSALALYSTLLREMIQSAKDCGYSASEVADFQRDINDRIKSALNQVMFDALSKLVKEGGEFKYPSMASVAMSLFQISAGVMNFHTEWHNGAACLIAKPHEYYDDCDLVDTKAHYQLNFRPKVGVEKNFYAMPQVFVSGRPAIHIYTKPEQEIQVARFVFEEDNVDMKFRAYYMVDGDDYDSWEVLVNLSSHSNPQELQFTLSKRQSAIVSFPWVKMYYSNTEGGAWSTHYDKFSTNMRVYYDEYNSFKPENSRSYTITTKAAGSATKNYYLIAFEVVPTNAPKLPWL